MTTDSLKHVDVKRSGQLALVTMNRPDKLNALTSPMAAELHLALAAIAGDSNVPRIDSDRRGPWLLFRRGRQRAAGAG